MYIRFTRNSITLPMEYDLNFHPTRLFLYFCTSARLRACKLAHDANLHICNTSTTTVVSTCARSTIWFPRPCLLSENKWIFTCIRTIFLYFDRLATIYSSSSYGLLNFHENRGSPPLLRDATSELSRHSDLDIHQEDRQWVDLYFATRRPAFEGYQISCIVLQTSVRTISCSRWQTSLLFL